MLFIDWFVYLFGSLTECPQSYWDSRSNFSLIPDCSDLKWRWADLLMAEMLRKEFWKLEIRYILRVSLFWGREKVLNLKAERPSLLSVCVPWVEYASSRILNIKRLIKGAQWAMLLRVRTDSPDIAYFSSVLTLLLMPKNWCNGRSWSCSLSSNCDENPRDSWSLTPSHSLKVSTQLHKRSKITALSKTTRFMGLIYYYYMSFNATSSYTSSFPFILPPQQ